MREICSKLITETVKRLCIDANCHLTDDVKGCIRSCRDCESWQGAREILDRIIENYEIADEMNQPVCQDTGVACVFLKIGQDVHIEGNLYDAVIEDFEKISSSSEPAVFCKKSKTHAVLSALFFKIITPFI